jgi:formylglycine-generating enzyme required for sulfatase activity
LKFLPPPGTVKIKDNFYADESELTNIDYKEFLYRTAKIFGKNSQEYIEVIPDTSVWFQQNYTENLKDIYLQHPIYDNYPLVGITLEQAKLYTNWRTERVAEMLLLRRNLIKPNFNYTLDVFFTIDRYIEGDYDWIISKKNILIPVYKIPTTSEWELFAGKESEFSNGIDSLTTYNKNILKGYKHLHNTKNYHLSTVNKDAYYKSTGEFVFITSPAKSFGKNIYGLYGTIGNVSELVLEDNICKGGNWTSKIGGYDIEKDINFHRPNCWTGLRNIAKFELIKIKNES